MKKFTGSAEQKRINDDREKRMLVRELTERFCSQMSAAGGSFFIPDYFWLFDRLKLRELRAKKKRADMLDAIGARK